MNYTKPLIGLAITALFSAVQAETGKESKAANTVGTSGEKISWSDRQWSRTYESDRQGLNAHLQQAGSVQQLKDLLKDKGFMITSINEMEDDELEYEVVNGKTTFEVHAEKRESGQLTELEVTSNYWIAEQTKRALNGDSYILDSVKYDPTLGAMSRDVQYLPKWMKDKEKLEQALITGDKLVDYMTKTKALGYEITSINDSEPGYIEYEIVKDGQSFEVQLERDEITQIVNDVDVTANIWMSEKTEKALGE